MKIQKALGVLGVGSILREKEQYACIMMVRNLLLVIK